MTTQRIPLGELDVLIMGKVLPIRRAPANEQRAIAEALVGQMNERIVRRFDFQLEFRILEINDGCIRVKFSLALALSGALGATAAAVAQYPDFKEGAKALWDDANAVIEYMAEGRACTARYAGARLTERLYGPVPEGHTLSQIASELNCGGVTAEQVMIAVFEANREQFIDDNLNLVKAGGVLAIPGEQRIAEISVQRANMQVMKHRRRFEALQHRRGAGDAD